MVCAFTYTINYDERSFIAETHVLAEILSEICVEHKHGRIDRKKYSFAFPHHKASERIISKFSRSEKAPPSLPTKAVVSTIKQTTQSLPSSVNRTITQAVNNSVFEMFRLVIFVAVVASAAAQGQRYVDDPRIAAILSEQRYLSGDGTFGAAYTQEDGVDFKEESDAAGNRKGSYSYVDPTGQRRTVTYTAGKNGFVASGDHLPVAPAPPPHAAAAPAAPRYNSAPAPAPAQYNSAPRGYPSVDDGQYYPELYEREDVQSPAQYRPAAPVAPQYSGVQQPQYVAPKAQPQYSGIQNSYQAAPQPQYSGVAATPAPAPRPQQYFSPSQDATESPHRFFPPGKLDLNRSPDGYSYSFSSKF